MTGIRRLLRYTRLRRPISIKCESEGQDSDVPHLLISLVQKRSTNLYLTSSINTLFGYLDG